MCDLVHNAHDVFHLPLPLTSSGNRFLNMSDSRETAICSLPGITHISDKNVSSEQRPYMASTSCTK